MIRPDNEVYASNTKSTHAVDILAFVEAQEIPFLYFETPYYLSPAPGGEKIYALLRETLRSSGKIGIAYVEIHARQHLAALIPQGQSLVLNTLRWASESRSTKRGEAEGPSSGNLQEWELTLAACAGEPWNMWDREIGIPEQDCDKVDACNVTEFEVEELDDLFVDEDEPDSIDDMMFFVPTNPHAHPGTPAGRKSPARKHHADYRARSRLRRTLH